jgi:hypothetical protein
MAGNGGDLSRNIEKIQQGKLFPKVITLIFPTESKKYNPQKPPGLEHLAISPCSSPSLSAYARSNIIDGRQTSQAYHPSATGQASGSPAASIMPVSQAPQTRHPRHGRDFQNLPQAGKCGPFSCRFSYRFSCLFRVYARKGSERHCTHGKSQISLWFSGLRPVSNLDSGLWTLGSGLWALDSSSSPFRFHRGDWYLPWYRLSSGGWNVTVHSSIRAVLHSHNLTL